ncbi:MAG: hypothetical protein ABI183_17810 [Polyangiaceae bacterium]
MKRWTLLALLGVVSASAACASILGIESGILDNGEGGTEAGVQICVADGGDHPDTSAGIFVYGDVGQDVSNCGDESTPCKTLNYGITKAKGTSGKTTVFVAVGDSPYNETVKLLSNITVEGGWTVVGSGDKAEWDRVCSFTDATQIATIVGTESAAVRADDLGGEATLRYLAIRTKVAGPGESIYGVFASGSSTRVMLDNVFVEVGVGGPGKPGADGIPGLTGGPSCPIGNAITSPSAEAGVGAQLGTVGANGVSPKSATNGESGATGGNGLRGTDGGCIACLACAGGLGACSSAPDSCGGVGKSGCGGGGGGGGAAGGSGGSAVGIYAWAGAVVVVGGKIDVAGGGNGGAGGNGASGGEGGAGEIGDVATACSTSCLNAGLACTATVLSTGAGTPGLGTRGANGSTGGAGGGGAGGYAFGVVSELDASVIVDAGVNVKSGGTGGAPGGASGLSSERFP